MTLVDRIEAETGIMRSQARRVLEIAVQHLRRHAYPSTGRADYDAGAVDGREFDVLLLRGDDQ